RFPQTLSLNSRGLAFYLGSLRRFPALRIRAFRPSNCSGCTGGIGPATLLSLERTSWPLGYDGRPGRPSVHPSYLNLDIQGLGWVRTGDIGNKTDRRHG